MSNANKLFFDIAIEYGALLFGDFTLKSGRQSPYFFNAGKFSSGRAIREIAEIYAKQIEQHYGSEPYTIFGPAYKGIPLSATISASIAERFDKDIPFVYNRKEIKDHGEGGVVVGDFPNDRVVLVDDVITAGTAIDESLKILSTMNVKVVGMMVALDRQERAADSNVSAIELVEERYGFPVHAIATLDELISYIEDTGLYGSSLQDLTAYKEQWGINR